MPNIAGLTALAAGDLIAASDMLVVWDASAAKAKRMVLADFMSSLTNGTFSGTVQAGAFSGPLTGNASTATKLATARAINGVDFDGTAAITVTAAAGTLSGTTLNATVVTSSLTTVGALAAGSLAAGFGNISIGASSVTAGAASFTTGAFSGKITIAVTGEAIQVNGVGAGGASKSAYTLLNGTNGASAAVNWYVGMNVFATDGSYEVKDGGGTTGYTITPAGAATFTHTLTSTGNLTVGASKFVVTAATGQLEISGPAYFDGAYSTYIDSSVVGAHGGSIRIYASNGAASVLSGTFSATGLAITGALTGVTTLAASGTISVVAPTIANATIALDSTVSNGYTAQVTFRTKTTGGSINLWSIGSNLTSGANSFSIYDGSVETFKIALGGAITSASSLAITGALSVTGAATTQSAGVLSLGGTQQTTVGAAGGASALPATPTGYIKTYIGSTQFVIPYYAQA